MTEAFEGEFVPPVPGGNPKSWKLALVVNGAEVAHGQTRAQLEDLQRQLGGEILPRRPTAPTEKQRRLAR